MGGTVAGLPADRASEVVLAARVARQFYLEGVSKVDIADRMGISGFRVARLLDAARDDRRGRHRCLGARPVDHLRRRHADRA